MEMRGDSTLNTGTLFFRLTKFKSTFAEFFHLLTDFMLMKKGLLEGNFSDSFERKKPVRERTENNL